MAGARRACRPTVTEVRGKKRNDQGTTELPVCEGILYAIEDKLFVNNSWAGVLLDNKMTYMGAMWGYDIGVRIGEMTAPEKGCTDHNIRANEVILLLCTTTADCTANVNANSDTRRMHKARVLFTDVISNANMNSEKVEYLQKRYCCAV